MSSNTPKYAEAPTPSSPRRESRDVSSATCGQKPFYCGNSMTELFLVHTRFVIAKRSLHAPAGIIKFTKNHTTGNSAALQFIIRHSILLSPQQHIAAANPGSPGKKFSPWRTECQGNVPLCTGTHQRRRCSGIRKGYNALQRVQRISGYLCFFPIGHNIFSIQGQIDIFGSHEQRIQQMFHRDSSIAAAR